MFKTAAVPIIFVACAVLAGASTSKAQQLTTQKPRLSEDAWHNHGWGFAGPGVYNEKNPSKRKRLAGLLHMAHVHAVTQLCPDVELIHANIAQLFASDGFGTLTPTELTFVGGRISEFKIWREDADGRRGLRVGLRELRAGGSDVPRPYPFEERALRRS